MHRTAGAAKARIPKKERAYSLAVAPVMPVPINSSKGCSKARITIVMRLPRNRANERACPPTAMAPASFPAARCDATKGVVAVQKKLKM